MIRSERRPGHHRNAIVSPRGHRSQECPGLEIHDLGREFGKDLRWYVIELDLEPPLRDLVWFFHDADDGVPVSTIPKYTREVKYGISMD